MPAQLLVIAICGYTEHCARHAGVYTRGHRHGLRQVNCISILSSTKVLHFSLFTAGSFLQLIQHSFALICLKTLMPSYRLLISQAVCRHRGIYYTCNASSWPTTCHIVRAWSGSRCWEMPSLHRFVATVAT